jgi:hypothetical protein
LEGCNFEKKTDGNIRMEYWQGEKKLKMKKDSKRERKKILISPLKEGFLERKSNNKCRYNTEFLKI